MQLTRNRCRCFYRPLVLAACALGLSSLCGCGNKPPATAPQQPGSIASPSQQQTAKSSDANSTGSGRTETADADSRQDGNQLRVDAQGRKWWGDTPYDVWFDDPLSVAAEGAKAAAHVPQGAATPQQKPAEPVASQGAKQGGHDWGQVVTVAVLEDEIKRLRGALAEHIKSVGTYNARYKEIQSLGATMAAVGCILAEHPQADRWKERAPAIRELGARIEQSSRKLGREDYDKTRIAFEQLTTVLDGGKPAELAASDDSARYSEKADLPGLMRSLDGFLQRMKNETGSRENFDEHRSEAEQSAAVMSALAEFVSDASFPNADEAEYTAAARGLRDASRAMGKDAMEANYPQFLEALNRTQKRCDQCHAKYRLDDM